MKYSMVWSEFPIFVSELSWEKLAILEPLHKDRISFPEIEREDIIIVDPLELPFATIDELSLEFVYIVDKYIPIFPF